MSNEELKPGYYRARGIAGSEQFGLSSSGGEQVSVGILLLDSGRRVTTVMAFAGGARDISIARLKALGWDGSDELRDLDKNEVQVEIKYEDYQGTKQMRCEVKDGARGFAFKSEMPENVKRGFMAGLAKSAAQLDATRRSSSPNAGRGGDPWDQKPPKVNL